MRRRRILFFVFLCFVGLSYGAADEFPLKQWTDWNQHASGRYPGQTWLKYATPEEAGWSSEKLGKAREYFETINSAAVLVVYDGAVLAAWGNVETRYMCHSVRKSFLSALYGIHVSEGNIDPNKTLAELNIDDEPPLTPAEKQARVIDLLKSRSGIYHPAAYETAKMKKKRPKRGSHKPGEFFYYNNWDFNALGALFERQTGTKIFQEFEKRFALPLGMEDFRVQDGYYHHEPKHSRHPAYPFRMSARDMARFGLLFLREGRWQDRQILTQQWIQESTAPYSKQEGAKAKPQYAYGYLWWPVVDGPFKDLQMVSARGYGGHSIDIVPAANLVFVHRVDTFWDLDPSFGTEKKSVKDSQRIELLDRVLRARAGAPRPHPKLIPLPAAPQRADVVKLDPDILPRYVGAYDFGDFKLRVKAEGDGLSMSGSDMGNFRLLPLSETKFIMEDVGAPVTFDLDEKGEPLEMTIETTPGKQRRGSAIIIK